MGAFETVRPSAQYMAGVRDMGGLSSAMADDVARELLAVLYLDVEGYSLLIARDDAGTARRLGLICQDLLETQALKHDGQVAQVVGDSVIILFKSLTEAAICAFAIQRLIPSHAANAGHLHPIRFRAGIDIGDVITTADGKLHGGGVNVAARLQTLSPPGGVCVSSAAHDRLRHQTGARFGRLDDVTLKNIDGPSDAYVWWPGATEEQDLSLPRIPAPPSSTGVAFNALTLNAAPPRLYPAVAEGPPRIAVLPFRQSGGARLPNHIRNGLVEDIVEQLAGLRELRVISHGSTVGLPASETDPVTIGRRLDARYLVRGSLRREEGRLKISAELVLAENAEVLWKGPIHVEGPLSFEVQDRLVTQIVTHLAPRVRDMELSRIRGKRPEHLSVYEKVLLAREYVTLLEPDRFRSAKILLDGVMAADPGYADAYALAAEWHVLNLGQDWSGDRKADTAAIDIMTRKALALDGGNVRALICDGHRKSLLHRDYAAAMHMFRRAHEVSPHSARVWQRGSFTYAYAGEAEEAIRRAEHALALSPCDREPYWFHSALCIAHYTAGHFDEAAEWGLLALSQQTMLRSTAGWAAASLVAAGRVDEARAVAARTMAQWPERRVATVVAHHPYRDPERRRQYGEHLAAAGFP